MSIQTRLGQSVGYSNYSIASDFCHSPEISFHQQTPKRELALFFTEIKSTSS